MNNFRLSASAWPAGVRRIPSFSPGAEVPFCGHASIAAAVALAERRGVGTHAMDTVVGPVVIKTRHVQP